jgi:hypothetical protein
MLETYPTIYSYSPTTHRRQRSNDKFHYYNLRSAQSHFLVKSDVSITIQTSAVTADSPDLGDICPYF